MKSFQSLFKRKSTFNEDDFPHKWVPNDVLYQAYNQFLNKISGFSRIQTKREYLLKEINLLQERISKPKTNLLDTVTSVKDEQEMMTMKRELQILEFSIEKLNNTSDQMLDEWKRYLKSAQKFLEKYDLTYSLNINDILSSENIKSLIRKEVNKLMAADKAEELREKYTQLSLLFDVRKSNFNVAYSKNRPIYLKTLLERSKMNVSRDNLLESLHSLGSNSNSNSTTNSGHE